MTAPPAAIAAIGALTEFLLEREGLLRVRDVRAALKADAAAFSGRSVRIYAERNGAYVRTEIRPLAEVQWERLLPEDFVEFTGKESQE